MSSNEGVKRPKAPPPWFLMVGSYPAKAHLRLRERARGGVRDMRYAGRERVKYRGSLGRVLLCFLRVVYRCACFGEFCLSPSLSLSLLPPSLPPSLPLALGSCKVDGPRAQTQRTRCAHAKIVLGY